MPTVSVIIPTYQHAQFISDAIQSVLDQTYRDFEVIIINDGSTDRTAEILDGYSDRVTVITQPNRGLPASRNVGINHSLGEFVAFLDADDFWLSNKLEKQVQLMNEDPDLGLIFTNATVLSGAITKGTIFDLVTPKSGWVEKELFQDNFMPMPTILVRRSCFKSVGLFDENLRSCEDYDLWLRISHLYPVAYIDEPLACYRIGSSQMSQDDKKMLSALIQMKTKAIINNPEIKDLALEKLDNCYYNLFPRLAKFLLIDGEVLQCREILEDYRQLRGRTFRYWLLILTSHLPILFSRPVLMFWGWIHDKSILKVTQN